MLRFTLWLLKLAEQIEEEGKKRKAEPARQKHIAKMKALAAREAQVWQQVRTLFANGLKILGLR